MKNKELGNEKTFISLLLFGMAYSQQQIDIPWPTLADSDWPMIKHDHSSQGDHHSEDHKLQL